MVEAGELAIPLAEGTISKAQICGDLADLAAGRAGRKGPDDITIFKSVGNAAMDLAAALTAMTGTDTHD